MTRDEAAEQMMSMYEKGYSEGFEDAKAVILESLTIMQNVTGPNKQFNLPEIIEGITNIGLDK